MSHVVAEDGGSICVKSGRWAPDGDEHQRVLMNKTGAEETTGGELLAVQGIAKSFGAARALDGVSLALKSGEFVALLGPNGAGKTTLFQILTGLFSADAGSVRILGYDIRVEPVAALAHFGIVFQQPTLDLDLGVAANLRFHARLHGLKDSATAIAVELDRFGLAGRAEDKARALSGGMRRRLELARALLHRPRLLLMDEPTVGLDPAAREDLLARVLALRAQGTIGVLWATHLVEEAERADQIVVLDAGRILKIGTPAEIVRGTGAESLVRAFLALTGGAGRDVPAHG